MADYGIPERLIRIGTLEQSLSKWDDILDSTECIFEAQNRCALCGRYLKFELDLDCSSCPLQEAGYGCLDITKDNNAWLEIDCILDFFIDTNEVEYDEDEEIEEIYLNDQRVENDRERLTKLFTKMRDNIKECIEIEKKEL